MQQRRDPDTMPEPEGFVEVMFPELLKTFKPAFLGRLNIVPFYPLSDEVIKRITALKLAKIGKRIQENYQARFSYTPQLIDTIAARCTEVDTGARNIDRILIMSVLFASRRGICGGRRNVLPDSRLHVWKQSAALTPS